MPTSFNFLVVFLFVIFWGYYLRKPKFIPSDHCDGYRFFYKPRFKRNIFKLLKWMLFEKRTPWPAFYPIKSCIPESKKDDLTLTWVNHSTVLIQWKKYNIITDPIWSERCSPFKNLGPKRVHSPGIAKKDLPPIDLILVSHNHYDHMDLKTLKWIAQRDDCPIVTTLGNKKYLKSKGLNRITELDWGQEFSFNSFQIHCVPAKHFSSRGLWDHDKTLWAGFIIKNSKDYIYFAGDTGWGDHFEKIKNIFGRPYLALIPIGAYLPRWIMEPVHLCPKEAFKAFQTLDPYYAMAIHFRTFQLSDEGIDDPEKCLKEEIQKAHLTEDRFWIPFPGQSRTFTKV